MQVRIFKQRIHRVQTKSRHAALVPPARNIKHRVLHGRITPVEVRLLHVKIVIVILIGRGIELPSRAAEIGVPVIRRLSVPSAVAPDVPVAMSRGARGLGIKKPFVLIGSMVYDEIKNDMDAALLGLTRERVEIRQGPVHRIDVFVVGNVVAEVHLR